MRRREEQATHTLVKVSRIAPPGHSLYMVALAHAGAFGVHLTAGNNRNMVLARCS